MIIVGALIIVPDNHQSFVVRLHGDGQRDGLRRRRQDVRHAMFWYVFAIGLAMAQYTITGYDASAHMAEETHEASRMAAVGMVSAVIVSVIAGFILLVAITFAIPDTARRDRELRDHHPVDLDRVDEPDLVGGRCSSSCCRGAVLLPHGIRRPRRRG